MSKMPENHFDAIVTDPPYEIGYNGCKWDSTGIAFNPATWENCRRVAKPGAHMLTFGGSRTFHRMTSAIEDAGWEIRDVIMWLYGSGFPKSKNLTGKWQGFGTALKPAYEPILIARKPIVGTVEENVNMYGTGVFNITACRVPAEKATGWTGKPSSGYGGMTSLEIGGRPVTGRWPANVMHDGSADVLDGFPQIGEGSPSRFFYSAKASTADREEGLHSFRKAEVDTFCREKKAKPRQNCHPTVKPTELMRYLCKLVTPPGGLILDPFAGSGSTGKAALLEGFRFIGIEKEKLYAKIAKARLAWAEKAYAGA